VQDAAKVIVCKWMQKYNIFGVNDTGAVEKTANDADTDDVKQPLLRESDSH
jgi:hypothetical protein